MIDINELRQLAQAATPGGWYVEQGSLVYGCKDVTDGEEKWRPVIACIDDDEPVNYEGNAAFIAAANPVAITELLDRLETTEKELEKERLRLAACSVAALGYFEGCAQEYRSAALDDVLKLRAKIVEMERQAPVCRAEDVAHAGSLLPALSVPEGFKLVPIEPTDAMLKAAQKEWLNDPLQRTTTMWKAMLAATKGQ